MRNKIKSLLFRVLNASNALYTVLVIIITFMLLCTMNESTNKKTGTDTDWSVFLSIFLLLAKELVNSLRNMVRKKNEDSLKLTKEYEHLVQKYKGDFLKYSYNRQACQNKKRKRRVSKKDKEIIFPIIRDANLAGKKIRINDKSSKMYQLPSVIEENYRELLTAHNASVTYNSLTIRIDDWKMKRNTFVISSSRTTYFNTLVTNRVMDFLLDDRTTVRDRLAYPPFVPALKESMLSNHLGVNGIIISSDEKMVLTKRKRNEVVAKRTYSVSIDGVLETKSALNTNGKFTPKKLYDAIKEVIAKEYALEENEIKETQLIAAYRDVVEGGKPQLLFYAEINLEFKKIQERSKKRGKKVKSIGRENLKKMYIAPDGIKHGGKFYNMVPAASASFFMLKEYLEEKGVI